MLGLVKIVLYNPKRSIRERAVWGLGPKIRYQKIAAKHSRQLPTPKHLYYFYTYPFTANLQP